MYSTIIKNLIDCISKVYSPTCTIAFIEDLINELQVSPAQFVVELKKAKYDYAMKNKL